MIILRVFLYIICISSIGWSVLVFGGPLVVKRIILAYSDGTLNPSEITISPTLDINIGRVDYSFQRNEVEFPIKGFSRSTEISWSLFKERPFLIVDLGPTLINDIAIAENIKIYTPSYSRLDWEDLFLVVETKNLELKTLGALEGLILHGNISHGTSKIFNLGVEAEMVTIRDTGYSSWSANSVSGKLTELDLKLPIQNQLFSVNFAAQNIVGDKPNLTIKKAVGSVYSSKNNKNVEIDLDEIKLLEHGGKIERINVDTNYDGGNFFRNLKVSFFNGIFPNGLPSFSQIMAEISMDNDESYDALVYGNLGEFEIYNSNIFLGLMPSSNFNTKLKLNFVNSRVTAESKINLDNSGGPEIHGLATLGFKLDGLKNISQCYSLDCEISEFKFNAKINVDEDWIKGSSICQKNSCKFNDTRHSISTSDTVKLFEKMNRVGLVNPLSSVYLYGLISSGQKINSGHELKFQF